MLALKQPSEKNFSLLRQEKSPCAIISFFTFNTILKKLAKVFVLGYESDVNFSLFKMKKL